MKTVYTPTMMPWQLHNGAVLCDGHKIASVVLAINPAGVASLLLVDDADEQKFEYIGLHQPRLVDLIFQYAALMHGEHYNADCSAMNETDIKHVWFDETNLRYYWFDETQSHAIGPYRTKEAANEQMMLYVKHVLGNKIDPDDTDSVTK
jgi:hypothetical protein